MSAYRTGLCHQSTFLFLMGVVGGGKTLCEILTVANVMPLPIAGPSVDNELSRRSFGLLSLNMGCDPIRGWPSRRGCSAAPMWASSDLKAASLPYHYTPKGTSTPATCRQPSSSAVQSSGAHALAALPAVAKMCKVCHWGRLPIRPGGLPMYRRRFPYPVAFPIRYRGSPCDSTASHTGHLPIRYRGSPIRFDRSPQAGHSPIATSDPP